MIDFLVHVALQLVSFLALHSFLVIFFLLFGVFYIHWIVVDMIMNVLAHGGYIGSFVLMLDFHHLLAHTTCLIKVLFTTFCYFFGTFCTPLSQSMSRSFIVLLRFWLPYLPCHGVFMTCRPCRDILTPVSWCHVTCVLYCIMSFLLAPPSFCFVITLSWIFLYFSIFCIVVYGFYDFASSCVIIACFALVCVHYSMLRHFECFSLPYISLLCFVSHSFMHSLYPCYCYFCQMPPKRARTTAQPASGLTSYSRSRFISSKDKEVFESQFLLRPVLVVDRFEIPRLGDLVDWFQIPHLVS